MNTKKFLKEIIILLLMTSTSFAQVYLNKGPAFLSSGKIFGGFDQKTITALYAVWNVDYFYKNSNAQKETESKFTDLITKSQNKNIILKPLDIQSNVLDFGYHDENGDYTSWDFVGVEYGYCHGMSLLTRQFLYFADFKPEMSVPVEIAKSPAKLKQYFENKIDDVMNSKPTVFPGYENLAKLSNSIFKQYLQRHVVDQWGINTARQEIYSIYKNWPELELEDVVKAAAKLESYLSKGFYPRIILGAPLFENENPHVVLVTKYRIEKTEDEFEYCLRLSYLDVGGNEGSRVVDDERCIGVGSKIILPRDEERYFQNIVLNSNKK